MSDQQPCAKVARAAPWGNISVWALSSPTGHGTAVTLTHGEASRLHQELGELLAENARKTCTCGIGPWSEKGRCENCGGTDLGPAFVIDDLGHVRHRRHFSDEELDEIAREVSKRIARRVRNAS